MQYVIKQYTFDQAEKYGYIVKVSSNRNKKLDVYKDNVKICSIGDSRYKDFPTHIQENEIGRAHV